MAERPLREHYADYLQGRLTFEELTEATDRAVEEYERQAQERSPSNGNRALNSLKLLAGTLREHARFRRPQP